MPIAFAQALCEILKNKGVITQKRADALIGAFRQASKSRFDNFLLSEGLIDKEDLLEALSEYYQVPAIDVMGIFFDHHLLRMFDESFLVRNLIIPFERDENMLVVVASDPSDPELLPKIGKFVSYDIRFNVGIAQDIINSIREYYDESPAIVDQDVDLREEHELEREERRVIQKEEELVEDVAEGDERLWK